MGDPMAIPTNNWNTNFQSTLFHMYGIIKILINTSNIKITGTISIVGNTKERPETQMAEKPKPLNPLTIEAIKTTNNIKIALERLISSNERRLI